MIETMRGAGADWRRQIGCRCIFVVDISVSP
jgi:hypothetical protein